MNSNPINRTQQQGAVLLLLIFSLFGLGALLFLSSVNTHALEVRQHQDVRAELEKAKWALIGYALNYESLGLDNVSDTDVLDEGPGRLPCPDIDNDGVADSTVTECTDNVRGRLPQYYDYSGNRVAINNTFANVDEQFWYVVAPEFKETATSKVNHLTTGTLSIDGVSGYVAVIIAPGEALAGQDRTASQTAPANYLEQGNLSGTSFINSYPADPDAFNDQVIGIKASELDLTRLRGTDGNPEVAYEPTRLALYAYWLANSALPADTATLATYGENQGYGWFLDEDYLDNTLVSFELNTFYPYVRYKLEGCTTRWYWFIPDYPGYSPEYTYVSGSAC